MHDTRIPEIIHVSFAFSDIPELSGKTAIVTGANTGIGLEIARGLARKGARVLLACRDGDKATAAIEDISRGPERVDLDFLPLDLANMASIREAARLAGEEPKIDMLVNNAGIMIPPLDHAIGGAESQFAVNHLGHFALTGLLLGKLAADGGARVVSQSSIAHRGAKIDFDNLDGSRGYVRTQFYGQSKLANLLFALELDRRLRAAGSPVVSIACHPGVAQSELTRHMGVLGKIFGPAVGIFLNTSAQGALPALQAATDPAAEGGDYYGPYGLREMSGNTSGAAYATPTARDPLLAARLWAKSVELTGVDPGLPPAAA
ncbi:SDR family NAD(P)-dependent oxidoreductase [Altererythrobacter oceanensis]|uniref:SDR family NAD(P)-dependent oxidoreductase n=1 Tax=Qipengyuania oceanensis TaxID=1463597 RepID=A0A844YG64_9SPHN|nr:oxidoreductase [Qipengyuania oceanensis]MXO63500.1 SDR family NAD(P)-dependent oxidoreductase [Qipengyuania oceanensis]